MRTPGKADDRVTCCRQHGLLPHLLESHRPHTSGWRLRKASSPLPAVTSKIHLGKQFRAWVWESGISRLTPQFYHPPSKSLREPFILPQGATCWERHGILLLSPKLALLAAFLLFLWESCRS